MSSRFEREIEELLRKLDGEQTAQQLGKGRRQGWTSRLQRLLTRRWGFLTTEQLISGVVALVLFSYIARFAVPAIGRYVALAFLSGVIVLLAYAVSTEFRRRR